LQELEATGPSRQKSASEAVTNMPLERTSRFDYCFDFIMDSAFEPDPRRFVVHQRCKKHVYGERGQMQEDYSAFNGEKVNTVRIGEMPGRQATIYNKTKEILSSSKSYWWKIWGLDARSFKETTRQIWRIGIRAGKNELDQWGFKRFEDFDTKAGDVVANILQAIRYTEPLKDDLNRSRWPMHPVWDAAFKASFKALEPYSSCARREPVMEGLKAEKDQIYNDQIIGCLTSKTALQGRDISELPATLQDIEALLQNIAAYEPEILTNKHHKAEEKFQFLN
jgi:hypothetical protein